MMTIIIVVIFALLGLVVGSFLNLCIDRLPLNKSIVKPRSHCDSCHKPLTAADLVPLLSYTWLRGRCRHRHRPRSARPDAGRPPAIRG
jgi:leader peptidase (prepilin peptidase)/N-methyltransferase